MTPAYPRAFVQRTILVESALSGFVMGLVVGVLAFGALAIVAGVLPEAAARWVERLRMPAIALCLVVVPLAGAALGWMEGRLKAGP